MKVTYIIFRHTSTPKDLADMVLYRNIGFKIYIKLHLCIKIIVNESYCL